MTEEELTEIETRLSDDGPPAWSGTYLADARVLLAEVKALHQTLKEIELQRPPELSDKSYSVLYHIKLKPGERIKFITMNTFVICRDGESDAEDAL